MLGMDTSHFMPHGHCILWKPQLLFPIVISDVVIFLSYISIPAVIYTFYKKRDDLTATAKKVLLLFVMFILLCGITHAISAYNYWNAEYWFEMYFKVATAVVSLVTALLLFKLRPVLLSIPSPLDHQRIIEELRMSNENLESRVKERTSEINAQKELLRLVMEGQDAGVVQYFPKYDEAGNIIDFRNKVITQRAVEIMGAEKASDLESEWVFRDFPGIKENGHYEKCLETFRTNSMSVTDPRYNPVNKRYYREIIFKHPDGNSLLISFSDVTDREEMKVQTMTQSKLMALGELAGGVAHEINTPLQIISGKMRKLERSLENSQNHDKEAIDQVTSTLKNIQDIVKNLKRLSAGSDDVNSEFSLGELLSDVESVYNDRLNGTEVELKFDRENFDAISVFANRTALFQIVCNLVSNAIDAVNEVVGIRLITFEVANTLDDRLELGIFDNGNAIPEEIRERIFDPLFTTKEVGKGTGLGLSLSKKFAENFGGELKLIQSETKKGFVIVIPRQRGQS